MEQAASISRAKQLANDIAIAVNDLTLQVDDRTRLAAACYFVALDHHEGITILFDNGVPSPALALLRPLYEAFIRGSWLHECASECELNAFKNGKDPPKIKELLERLERTAAFDSKILSNEHGKNWAVLCGLTHTGIQQVRMCLSGDAIERNCSNELIDEAMGYAGGYALLAGSGVARLADDTALEAHLLELGKAFVPE
jgi:hypothetical protein